MYLGNIDLIVILVFSITFQKGQGHTPAGRRNVELGDVKVSQDSPSKPNADTIAQYAVGSEFGANGNTKWPDSDESVWKEHITDPDGVPIYRGSIPVDGPRRSRYSRYPHPTGSVLLIRSLQYDDAGYYTFSDANGLVDGMDIAINGDHVCNESKPHTALVGNDITYNCRFTFFGSMVEPFAWEGPGTSSGAKFANVTKSDEMIWKHTYKGNGTASITIRVVASLNGTRRNATQYGCPTKPFSFRFTTGVLTVLCKNGFGGTDCTRKLTCHDDKPCKNKAVCTEGGDSVKCHCNKYTGFYCTDRILCKSTLCQNEGKCIDEVRGTYYCQCKPGYEGINCEIDTRTDDADNTLEKSGDTSLILYMLPLLLLPLAAVALIAFYMKRPDRRHVQVQGCIGVISAVVNG